MQTRTAFNLILVFVVSCAHSPPGAVVERAPVAAPEVERPAPVADPETDDGTSFALDRERYPLNCDDGNPLTPDDTLVDDVCVGLVDPDQDGAPNVGSGPPCTGPDSPEGCIDNCRFVANPAQEDADGDGIGDECNKVAEWDHVRTDAKVVALTFDDGYNDRALNGILNALEAHNARATFFLNGMYVKDKALKPATLRRLRKGGHLSGNHTFNHTVGDVPLVAKAEILDCEPVFEKAAGIGLKPLFRSPAYARRPWLHWVLLQTGYTVNLYASLDVHDWTTPPPPVDAIVECVTETVQPGDIVLFHAGPRPTPLALPAMLDALSKQGYHFVTAEELLYFGIAVRDRNEAAKHCDDYYSK